MKAVITIFNEELKNKKLLHAQVVGLCKEVKELETVTVFCPIPGKLVEFLSILKFHKLSYGTHFDPNHQEEIIVRLR